MSTAQPSNCEASVPVSPKVCGRNGEPVAFLMVIDGRGERRMLLWFSPPVYIKTNCIGMRAGINHVQRAAEQLLTWTKRGPKCKQAVEACVDAMEDDRRPQAFEEAAIEEGMLLSSD
jgi:hypothetical protein